jgi:hypothetical protein
VQVPLGQEVEGLKLGTDTIEPERYGCEPAVVVDCPHVGDVVGFVIVMVRAPVANAICFEA